MAGYSTRQSTYTTGDVIAAADTNDEFNQLISAFNASTGHTHDGTAGDGGPVSVLRDSNAYNRILCKCIFFICTTIKNRRWCYCTYNR